MKSLTQEFTKGLWSEIPPFRLVLGLCPALAVTTTAENGLGMGVAATFVLVCSNALVSMLRKVIPNEVRVACFIVIIATFVVCVEMITKAYFFALSESLGLFIPLIVVNCIILGRAEAFARKNNVVRSVADGLGMGIGFTLSLVVLGAVREFFGAGTLGLVFGDTIFIEHPFTFLQQAPGAFVALGLMLGLMNVFGSSK
ncbi:MAG: electron transport complex subunit E [Proteobacteria bacterium]|jgi:Na+-translocating ferredoxin:NAD+ oxidoreductase subunit E|nr:electron transport complex subunit E [Pseudomonadota bacterium]